MVDRCRLCGSPNLELCMSDGRHSNLHYYRCGNCALWNYDLSLGTDQSQYTAHWVSPLDPADKSNREVTQSWAFLRKRLPATTGRLMDIGCGNGRLLCLARNAGWPVRGMELSAAAAASIRADQGIDVDVADFLDYETVDGERYDVVVLRHVLEHLPDPIVPPETAACDRLPVPVSCPTPTSGSSANHD